MSICLSAVAQFESTGSERESEVAGNGRVPAERRLKSGTLAVGAARNGLALRMRVQCRRCGRSVGAVSPCTVQKPPSEEYHSAVFGSPQFYEVT